MDTSSDERIAQLEEHVAKLEEQMEDLAGLVGDLMYEVGGEMPATHGRPLVWEAVEDDGETVWFWSMQKGRARVTEEANHA